MENIITVIGKPVKKAFEEVGVSSELGLVTVSNRPDLCEFQCNGAMIAAKQLHKAPIVIAGEIADKIKDNEMFEKVEAVAPGFLNITLSKSFLPQILMEMEEAERFGVEITKSENIIVDYGGPNVAKPLHVGHLRSAVIGESVKRICRYMGNNTIGDIHLGDWGLQMGLIISELKSRKPDLPYFDENFQGDYPDTPPFTIGELEEIYPTASEKSKKDEAFKAMALEETLKLQQGEKAERALWNHIINVSVADLKKNYKRLNVDFELWNGESTVQPLIPDMVKYLKEEGYARMDQGALVVDVKEETDTKEMPPCMILKSDGASLYNTTDLATIIDRVKNYNPDRMIYLTDKRQNLYFEQIFRCAKKTKLLDKDTKMVHIGFGTVNGPGGTPFKTREGGVMRLEYLIDTIYEKMLDRIKESRDLEEAEAEKIAEMVSISAIKYGDLSNQAAKDYIFDVDKFISSEGNTGPYILYTIVRIGSILKKYSEMESSIPSHAICEPVNSAEKNLMLTITGFHSIINQAFEEANPTRICSYIYSLSNAFNSFYHETRILADDNRSSRDSHIELLALTKSILETCIDLLGFAAPDKM